jgi:hypothetical protein
MTESATSADRMVFMAISPLGLPNPAEARAGAVVSWTE